MTALITYMSSSKPLQIVSPTVLTYHNYPFRLKTVESIERLDITNTTHSLKLEVFFRDVSEYAATVIIEATETSWVKSGIKLYQI